MAVGVSGSRILDTNIPFISNVPGGVKGEVYKHLLKH
jgi:hypothetical protein